MTEGKGSKGRPVKKGGSKKVIDYDPLAWLDEGNEEGEVARAQSVAASSEQEPADSAAEAPPEIPVETDEEPGFGFFDEAPTPQDTDEDNEDVNRDSTGKETAYGFFDEEGEEKGGVDSVEESAAYGFFGDENDARSGDTETAAGEDSSAFGFFDEEPLSGSDTGPWKDEDAVIHLGPELVIRCIAPAHALISETLAQGFDIRLDAGDLQKIDSAGLQMIYSLVRTLEKTGQSISWTRTSPLIDQRAAELGLPSLCRAETDDADDASFGFF